MSEQNQTFSHFSCPVSEVLDQMDVMPDQGLAEGEARRRLEKHDLNKLRETRRRSVWEILIEQFKSMVIIVLVIAGTVAFVFQHWVEGIAIVAVLLVNAALGFTTELKAMRSMEALRQMGGGKVRARRDGEDQEMDAENLVPGDIIVMEAGDIGPADIRLIESHN